MVTKNAKAPKSSSTKEEVLTVAEYSQKFEIAEHSVRTKLKNGELELTHIEKNGKKVQAIKVSQTASTTAKGSKSTNKKPQEKVKGPKLIKVEALKTVDYPELIKDKDDEIKRLNKELTKRESKLDKLEKDVKRLNEVIKSKSELISSHEKLLQSRETELQELRKICTEQSQQNSKKITLNSSTSQKKKEEKKSEKKPGFFSKLFGKKSA